MENNKQTSLLSHIISILVLPFNVTVIVPTLLLYFLQYNWGWGIAEPFFFLILLAGLLLLGAGLMLLILSILQFAKKGKGTLAPWDPPKKLVVDGPYRYTRNPMISGVVLILMGQVLIFGSIPLLVWFTYFTLVQYIYFIKREEPHLEKVFGEDYIEYKKNVPRLLPRRTPWKPKKGWSINHSKTP